MFANARSEDSAANAIWVARGVLCCCSIIPLTICGTFCGLYWNLMNQANDYDDAIDATINDQHPLNGSKILPYDNCALGLDSQGDLVDTKWSVFLAFNSFLYLALCCCVVLMLLGTFFMPFSDYLKYYDHTCIAMKVKKDYICQSLNYTRNARGQNT